VGVASDTIGVARAPPGRMHVVALGLSGLIAVAGIIGGTHAASGADSYGYVSQADLWLAGHLKIDQRWLGLPVPFDDWALSPLGYKPGLEPGTIVPSYSPGLPLLMAGAKLVAGNEGPYFVVPLLGGLTVWLTFVLGRSLFSESVGLAACWLLAVSPAFLFQLMFPMSDVPVAAAWTLALVLAIIGRPLSAGLASTIAILIRPNLAPLVLGVGLIIVLPSPQETIRQSWRRAAVFSAGVLPGVLGVAAVNNYLYGSPLTSGYGPLTTIYHWEYFQPNLARYPVWLLQTQTPLILLGLLPLPWRRLWPADHVRFRFGAAVFIALLITPYLFYIPFEEWWYLRFLLSAFPIVLVLAVGALVRLRVPFTWIDHTMLATIVIVVSGWELTTAQSRGVFTNRGPEQRYVTIGRELAVITPPNAIFIAMQHSGSARFYSARMTVRYDSLPSDSLDSAIEILRARGFYPYFLLEEWEEPQFRSRFGGVSAAGRLGWAPVKKWATIAKVALYDPRASPP
jgi:hypothetical protein